MCQGCAELFVCVCVCKCVCKCVCLFVCECLRMCALMSVCLEGCVLVCIRTLYDCVCVCVFVGWVGVLTCLKLCVTFQHLVFVCLYVVRSISV